MFGTTVNTENTVHVAGVSFNRRSGELRSSAGVVRIGSGKQRDLLFLLMSNAGTLVSFSKIADTLYDGNAPSRGVIKVFASKLRAQLALVAKDRMTITAKRKFGYTLTADAS